MATYINKIRTASGDLQINYEALANLPTISNPNLLINSDFRKPINQRGKTIYTGGTSKIYTIDRWCLNTSSVDRKINVADGYIKFTNSSTSTLGYFLQHFENKLPNDYYTITVNVKSVSGSVWVGNVTGTSAQSVEWGNTKAFKLTTGINKFVVSGYFIGLYFMADFSSNVELYWVKLEQGKNSTQFTPRLYAEELMLCQRYLTLINGVRVSGVEQNWEDNSYSYSIPIKFNLQTTPRITATSTGLNTIDGICIRTIGTAILTGFTFEYSVRGSELIVLATNSATLSKNCYETQLYLNNNFYIYLDAEIY